MGKPTTYPKSNQTINIRSDILGQARNAKINISQAAEYGIRLKLGLIERDEGSSINECDGLRKKFGERIHILRAQIFEMGGKPR